LTLREPQRSIPAIGRWFMGRVANALLFALILLVPFVSAEAQQPRVYRVGYLGAIGSGPGPHPGLDAFIRELQTRGWVDKQNLVIEYRWAGGKIDELPRVAGELVRLNPDVIVRDPVSAPDLLAAVGRGR